MDSRFLLVRLEEDEVLAFTTFPRFFRLTFEQRGSIMEPEESSSFSLHLDDCSDSMLRSLDSAFSSFSKDLSLTGTKRRLPPPPFPPLPPAQRTSDSSTTPPTTASCIGEVSAAPYFYGVNAKPSLPLRKAYRCSRCGKPKRGHVCSMPMEQIVDRDMETFKPFQSLSSNNSIEQPALLNIEGLAEQLKQDVATGNILPSGTEVEHLSPSAQPHTRAFHDSTEIGVSKFDGRAQKHVNQNIAQEDEVHLTHRTTTPLSSKVLVKFKARNKSTRSAMEAEGYFTKYEMLTPVSI